MSNTHTSVVLNLTPSDFSEIWRICKHVGVYFICNRHSKLNRKYNTGKLKCVFIAWEYKNDYGGFSTKNLSLLK
jgi:hypothetical protein